MLVIVVQGKGVEAQRFEFDQHEVTIGRAEINDIVLPVSNVSKRHAHIHWTGECLIVSDRRSTNGTYVNGRKLLAALVIDKGDRVHIGDFTLAVHEVVGAASGQPSRASPQNEGPVPFAPAQGQPETGAMNAHPGLLPRMPWLDEWAAASTEPVLLFPFAESRHLPINLIVSLPAVLLPGETVVLRVHADARHGAAETGAADQRCRRSCALEVLLSLPDEGLVALGGEEGVLRVNRSERSPELAFSLRAREPGAARVEIGVNHRGARLATLLLRPEVRQGPIEAGPESQVTASLPVEPISSGRGPRLVLRVREGGVGTYRAGQRALRVELLQVPGEIAEGIADGEMGIEASLQEVMRTLYLGPEAQGLGSISPLGREAALRALFEGLTARLLPAAVREALEGLAAGSLLQVDASCPWVPWEALRIGKGTHGAYLGERFALSRGGLGSYTERFAQAPRLLLCPPGTAARREQQALAALDPRLVRVQHFAPLRAYLRDEPVAGWHISGHGCFERGDRAAAALKLEDGVFTPAQVAPAARFLRLGMRPPLRGTFVLLSVSESTPPLHPLQPAGTAMWIERLLNAGAGAVVATTWPVSSPKAALFAESFYRAWASQRPLAVAAAEARESIREDGDPSWLSYAVFGLPGARLDKNQ